MLDYLVTGYYRALCRECAARNNAQLTFFAQPSWWWSVFQLQAFRITSILSLRAIMRVNRLLGSAEYEKKAQSVLALFSPQHQLAQLFAKIAGGKRLFLTQQILYPIVGTEPTKQHEIFHDDRCWIDLSNQITALEKEDDARLEEAVRVHQRQRATVAEFHQIAKDCDTYIRHESAYENFTKHPDFLKNIDCFIRSSLKAAQKNNMTWEHFIKRRDFKKEYLSFLRKSFFEIVLNKKIDNINAYADCHGWRDLCLEIEEFISNTRLLQQILSYKRLLDHVSLLKAYIDNRPFRVPESFVDQASFLAAHQEVKNFIVKEVNTAINKCSTQFTNPAEIEKHVDKILKHPDFKKFFYDILFENKASDQLLRAMKHSEDNLKYAKIVEACFRAYQKAVCIKIQEEFEQRLAVLQEHKTADSSGNSPEPNGQKKIIINEGKNKIHVFERTPSSEAISIQKTKKFKKL